MNKTNFFFLVVIRFTLSEIVYLQMRIYVHLHKARQSNEAKRKKNVIGEKKRVIYIKKWTMER